MTETERREMRVFISAAQDNVFDQPSQSKKCNLKDLSFQNSLVTGKVFF